MALSQFTGLPMVGGFDPFLGQLERSLDRAFERALGGRDNNLAMVMAPFTSGSAVGHPMDIVETEGAFKVRADAPGFNPSDISVEMNEGTLTISGRRKEEKVQEHEGKVVRRERHLAQFTRSFTLPDNIKEDGITADLEQGVLTVTVPKTEPAPKPEPKRITVRGANGALTGAEGQQ